MLLIFEDINVIIFDFDGVIAESVNVKTNAFLGMYSKYGEEVSKKVVSHHISNGGMSRFEKFKFYHKEFLDRDLTHKEINNLALQFSELVVKHIIEVPYVEGALEFIKENHHKYQFFISTGTPQDEINYILRKKGIDRYFDLALGSPEKKIDHIKKILKIIKFSKKNCLFIGDADTDIEAAKKYNIPIIFREHSDGDYSIKYSKFLKVKNLVNISSHINTKKVSKLR